MIQNSNSPTTNIQQINLPFENLLTNIDDLLAYYKLLE